MEIENVKLSSKFGQWAEMVQACLNSGQSVRAWCEDNGINVKTYYYRLRRLKHMALGRMEKNIQTLPAQTASCPTFAELTLSESSLPEDPCGDAGAPAVTIKAGTMTINIHNEAGAAVITNVIRAAKEII